MKNIYLIKKAAPLALAFTLGIGAFTIQANDAVELPLAEGEGPVTDLFEQEGTSVFEKVTGKVSMVETLEDGRRFIRLETGEGGEADFFVEDQTVLVNDKNLAAFEDAKEGDYITAYYVEPLIMTMIYPAQYSASVLVLQGDLESIGVGVSQFDENRLNSEKDLYVYAGENTVILTQSGEAYEGSLDHKVQIVFYDFVMESYPGQTTASTIIVLDYEPAAPVSPDMPIIMDQLTPEILMRMTIFVNGEYLEDAGVYDENGEILFPLRAIAEALGYDVKWDGELGKIVVGVAITLSPGSTEYTIGRMAPQEMSVAPVVVDGATYVPGDFITNALQGQIDISQGIYSITQSEASDEE